MSKKKVNFIDSISHLTSECPKCKSNNNSENWFFGYKKSESVIEKCERQLQEIQSRKEKLKTLRDEVYNSMLINVKSVNIGFISERLFPALESFRFNHNDCRSTGGDPIDYVVFEGLAEKNEIDFIHFVDVKTGDSRLSSRQREIKQVIEDKNVKFRIY